MTAPVSVDSPARRDRVAFLDEICDLLWPAPARVDRVRGGASPHIGRTATGPTVSELIVVPSLRDPRLLVPAGRRTGAAAVRRYGEPGSLRARCATRALSWALASGAGGIVLRDRLRIRVPAGAPTIEAHLRDQLGHEVQVSMYLGAARANRKPVLQLLTANGRTVAFAKVGYTTLTRQLVRAEHEALDRIQAAQLTTVTVPAVRHLGRWADLEVLVLSALPVWRPRRELGAGQLTAAMTEVARVTGCTEQPLAASSYPRELAERLAAAPASADQRALQRELAELASSQGSVAVTFGAWHGDWTPWNMACTQDGLLVWDWERFAAGVPVGFDALHHWLQAEVQRVQRDPAAAAMDCVAHAPELLRPFGVRPQTARLTALLYFCELSTRYLADRQAEAGARLGAPGTWLIPALTAAAARKGDV